MNSEVKTNTYNEARSRWAYGKESAFRNDVSVLCSDLDIEAKATDLDKACVVCVRVLSFGYPAEYRLTEILSPKEMKEEFLVYASDIMRKYRKEFSEIRKNEARS